MTSKTRKCPHCLHDVDAAVGLTDKTKNREPTPGALSVCLYCSQPSVFLADLQLRKLTEDEEANPKIISALAPVIQNVQSKPDYLQHLLDDKKSAFTPLNPKRFWGI